MYEPFIFAWRRGFRIAQDTPTRRLHWNAKRGAWVGTEIIAPASTFRSREAAELELVRIRHHFAPEMSRGAIKTFLKQQAANA